VYQTVNEMQIRQTLMGMEMPSNMKSEMLIEMTATEKNNDEIRVDFSYLSSAVQVSSPIINFRVDSDTDIETLSGMEKEMAQIINSFVGKTVNIIFRTDGSIKSISGFDAIRDFNPANPAMAMFGEDAIRQLFEQSFSVYPDKEVRVGDSWSRNMELVMQGMNTNSESTLTLTSIADNVASLDMVITMVMTSTEAEIDGNISGEIKGKAKLDIPTGMIISFNQEGSVGGTLQARGMEIGMEMIVKGTFTLVQ